MAGCSFPVFYWLIFCIFWCAYLERKADAQQGGCRSVKFLPLKPGYYLKNHVVKKLLTGTRFRECEHHCFMTSECFSINIQIGPRNDHKVICELSNSDHIQHPEDLVIRAGSTYGVTENFCSSLKPCLNNAKCLYGYTDKKYLCVCASGFTGENCENDVDGCSSGLHNCSKNASCINLSGNFSCICNPGFTGDGRICSDVDECSSGMHTCSKNASCINTVGNFSCICNRCFTGDGRICSDSNSSLRRFEEYQEVQTNYPGAVEQFTIHGSLFLAFASKWKSRSHIYQLNNLTGKFALHQTIFISHANNLHHFMIADKHYLGVTLHLASKSVIYQWNGTQFVSFQNISLKNANEFHFFTILPERFLAVTTNNNVTSIYKWKDKQFEKFQDIASSEEASGVTTFVINNETFIAIANHWSSKYGHAVPSSVYKWSANSFLKTQSLQTYGAFDVKSFSISGDIFLAFANEDNISKPFDYFIYKWNGTMFTLFQSIPTLMKRWQYSWHAFEMCGETYLGGANNNRNSVVYRFSGSQFIKYQSLGTIPAADLTSFEYKDQTYLVVANLAGNSTVYKWV